ncbi:hypothetical protein D3C76_1428790 [compost metagenome]
MRGEAGVEAREQGRIVRLGVRRLLGVVGVVQANADDFAGTAHQRQIVLLANLYQRSLRIGTVRRQVYAACQQSLQRFVTTARQSGMSSKLIPGKYAVNEKIYFLLIIDNAS